MPEGSQLKGSQLKGSHLGGSHLGGSQPGRSAADALFTAPNLITLGRLCAVPLAFWLILIHRLDLAFFLFVLAGLSDAADGWLARRNGGNAIGAVLDPVADKTLLVTMYVTLAAVGVLPAWLAIMVVFRDLLIVGGVIVLAILGHPVLIRPLYVSKLNTALQIILVAATLFLVGFELMAPRLLLATIWTVAASTLVSGVAYVWVVAHGR